MYFTPQNPGDAELIAERIAPRLQHANSSVVLTTIKVILHLTNYMTKDEDIVSLCKKLSPPLGISHLDETELSNLVVKTARVTIRRDTECTAYFGKETRDIKERCQSFLL
jgi:AP-2 complex subunit beta-1